MLPRLTPRRRTEVPASAGVLALSLALLAPGVARATEQRFPISAAISQRSAALPLQDVFGVQPFSPGATLGTEYTWVSGRGGSLLQAARLGFVSSSGVLGGGPSLFTDLTYRYTAGFGLLGDLSLGLGYMHTFHSQPIFRQNAAHEYVPATDWGKPTGALSAALSIGYDFSRRTRLPYSAFIRYEWLAQTPYFDALPFVPERILSVGIRVDWRGH
jgi:hypothetical protein